VRFGAIDIGTNAARLLIGEVTKEGSHSYVKKISYTRVPLRLGEEVFENGKISKKKTEHFVKTIKAFQLISEIFEVKKLRACATSAMREAENAKKVISKIQSETGVNIEVISGDEEASLIFGTFFLLEFDKSNPFLVIDVGGGSTEVSVFEKGEKVASKSFSIGTLRMLKGKVDKNIWNEIHDWISSHVDLNSPHQIFGTGGNINSAHKVLGGSQSEPISIDRLGGLLEELKPLTPDQRSEKYQLKEDRADVIVPALQIFTYIMKELDANEIIVPKIGLSDGIIYDLYKKRKRV
jgi:exopolyphosphatase/guanosine-5'-triphosphate,3'-diphosphate pyrophosphatase